MNATLHINLAVGPNSEAAEHYGSAEKIVDLPFAPSLDIAFQSSCFANPLKPVEITYCIDDEEEPPFDIRLDTIWSKSEDTLDQVMQALKITGWQCNLRR